MFKFLMPTKARVLWTVVVFMVLAFLFLSIGGCPDIALICPAEEYKVGFSLCNSYVCTQAEQVEQTNTNIIGLTFVSLIILFLSYFISIMITHFIAKLKPKKYLSPDTAPSNRF